MNREKRLDRVGELASALFDGLLDEADQRELNDLLRGDPETCERYLQLADAHAALVHDHAGDALPSPVPVGETIPFPRQRRRFLIRALAAAAVVALLVANAAFWLGFRDRGGEPTASENWVAVASRAVDARWKGATIAEGDPLPPGPLVLSAGLVQIEFFSGATLIAEGPAELELVSAWEVECRSGRVRAFVPEPAQGFVVATPEYRAVDLGTEFALSVGPDGESELHVVDGEVRVDRTGEDGRILAAGEGIRSGGGTLEDISGGGVDFIDRERLLGLAEADEKTRFELWSSARDALRDDPALLAYFDFDDQKRWDRHLANLAPEGGVGAVIGARWTEGRWPGKGALEFKRITDRVRLEVPGEHDQLTYLAKVRVEGLYQWLSSLLLTDGFEEGEVHWQISDAGELIAGIKIPGVSPNTVSPAVIGPDDMGRWIHLALTVDRATGEVIHYLDGEAVVREVRGELPPLRIGKAEIGNWFSQGGGHPIRSLNGRIDEFAILSRAMTPDEIRAHFEAGR